MIVTLFAILSLLLLFVSKEQGLKTIGTICFNLIFILICIFLMANGAPVFVVSMLIAVIFVSFTLFYQFGFQKKTFLSVLACFLTLLLIFGIVSLFVSKIQISGLNELDLNLDVSQAVDVNIPLSMSKISIAVAVLSMIGVVMDASIAISSAMFEFYDSHHGLSLFQLLSFGQVIGYDILGTTINTLFLASMGDFYLYGIFFAMNHISFVRIINSKAVYQTFSGVLLGSLAAAFIIPISAGINLLYIKYYIRKQPND